MIWDKWLPSRLTEEEYNLVFEIDDALLYYEFVYFMQEKLLNYQPQLVSVPVFEHTDFSQTENQFIYCFQEFMVE